MRPRVATTRRVGPSATEYARMKQTRTVNLSDLTCFTYFLENNTMGRNRTNLVYEYFVYDKEKNTSKCGFCDRQIAGHHGSNLLYHLSIHHPAEYSEVIRRNIENKGGVVLKDSDGGTNTLAKVIENCNDTRSSNNLKEEANDQDNEEYEDDDPLQTSDDDDNEPPQKRKRRSIKIELAQSSSSHTPNEKHIKTYKLATQADKFDMLGKTVALKLRDIAAADDKQRLMAEKIINDALFLAEMGQLTLAHCNRINLE